MPPPKCSIGTAASSFGKDESREHSVLFTMFMSLKNAFFKM